MYSLALQYTGAASVFLLRPPPLCPTPRTDFPPSSCLLLRPFRQAVLSVVVPAGPFSLLYVPFFCTLLVWLLPWLCHSCVAALPRFPSFHARFCFFLPVVHHSPLFPSRLCVSLRGCCRDAFFSFPLPPFRFWWLSAAVSRGDVVSHCMLLLLRCGIYTGRFFASLWSVCRLAVASVRAFFCIGFAAFEGPLAGFRLALSFHGSTSSASSCGFFLLSCPSRFLFRSAFFASAFCLLSRLCLADFLFAASCFFVSAVSSLIPALGLERSFCFLITTLASPSVLSLLGFF